MPTNADPQSHTHTNRCWWNPDLAAWVCGQDESTPLVDVRDMLVVHTALLRELRLLPAAIERTGTGDRRRARVVAGHLALMCELLHVHHEGEDELLWPVLLERIPPDATDLVATGEAQHEGLDAALGEVDPARRRWVHDPSDENRQALAERVGHLHRLLSEHLDFEERALLPLAAAYLTHAEWAAIGEHGAAHTPRSALPLTFGMFAYEGDPVVLTDMLSSAPAPVRVLVPKLAPALYARRARAVHGTSRP